jgi:GT2 family glycosyltransferase
MKPAPDPTRRATRRRPVVSVCVANWNCRELLRNCLRSLTARRQGVRLEVIVVDNASSDGSADAVEREFPRVRLIRNDANAGFARACNQAAAVARGRYLFFLNNDTVVPRGALRRLCLFARDNPSAGLIGPRLRDGSGRIQKSARGLPTVAALLHRTTLLRWTGLFRGAYRRYRGRDDGAQTRRVAVLMGAALLMPRRLYRKVGGWDESYAFGGEDVELCARVGRMRDVIYHPETAITHFGRAATRQRVGWATAQTFVGTTRSLRVAGASGAGLFAYKLLTTLDLPLRALELGGRYLWAKLRGRTKQAERSRADLSGLAWFVRHDLAAFWRA